MTWHGTGMESVTNALRWSKIDVPDPSQAQLQLARKGNRCVFNQCGCASSFCWLCRTF